MFFPSKLCLLSQVYHRALTGVFLACKDQPSPCFLHLDCHQIGVRNEEHRHISLAPVFDRWIPIP